MTVDGSYVIPCLLETALSQALLLSVGVYS